MRKFIDLYDRSNAIDDGGINLTPLIDVVFIILMMFILVVPFLSVDKIALPPSYTAKNFDNSLLKDNFSVKIYVHSDNTIRINETAISLEKLFEFLKDTHQKFSDVSIQLYHDRKAHFGTYQSIKNAVERAGFESLDIVLQST
jgi:biopolymer transport protein ExbD